MPAATASRVDLPAYVARGYNLLATALLLLAGIAFGTLVLGETDLLDKIDDASLLLIGIIAAVWYLWGDNRFRLGLWPVALTAVGLVLQALGVLIERASSAGLGDNFGGLMLYLPLLIFLMMQYSHALDVLDRAEADRAEEEDEGEEASEGELIRMPAA